MEEPKKEVPKRRKREPPPARTNDPLGDYEQLVDQAILGVLGQGPKQ
jgi:hypothetical protein